MSILHTKKFLLEEVLALILSLIPLIYLALAWNDIPNRISVFWNLKKNPGFTSKNSLIYICILPFVLYHLFLIPQIIPLSDSKDAIAPKEKKFFGLKFLVLMAAFMFAIFTISFYQITQYG